MESLKFHAQDQESNYLETSPIDRDQLEKLENVHYKVKAQ
jgi:hypothetical protein